MKTKPVFSELEINNVPFEKLEYNNTDKIILFVDDINEQRWKITFFKMLGIKLLSIDLGYNYNSKDFKKYYYEDRNGIRHFKKYILEIEESEWINDLKKTHELEELKEARHYLVTFYDYALEVIACGINSERVDR